MKKIMLCLMVFFCFSSAAFADTKELKNLEKKYSLEIDKKNYKKAIEISLKIIDLAKKENEPSFISVYTKNVGEIYLYKTREYEKAWDTLLISSNYYNTIAFMRLSEMAYKGFYIEKDPSFAIALLGFAIDTLRSDREPINWNKKINDKDEVGEVLISLNNLIHNLYIQSKEEIQKKSTYDISAMLAMGYVYELCFEGKVDGNLTYCDTQLAVDYYAKASDNVTNEYLSKYSLFKVQEILLRVKGAVYKTYKDLDQEANAFKQKEEMFSLMSDMSKSEIPLSLIAVGRQYEFFGDNDKAKNLYKQAFENGLLEQSYNLFNKLDTKK